MAAKPRPQPVVTFKGARAIAARQIQPRAIASRPIGAGGS